LEKFGLIFIWYHVENEEPWELPTLDEIENKKFVLHGSNEFLVHSHIQDIPENGADIGKKKCFINTNSPNSNICLAHLSTVHGTSMLSGCDIRKLRNSWLSFGTHIWDAKYKKFCNSNFKTFIYILFIFIYPDGVKMKTTNIWQRLNFHTFSKFLDFD
jgi:3-Ketosteroid 9alpha-hydroxylase C-terminal domain